MFPTYQSQTMELHHFYTPCKSQKKYVLKGFSGGREMMKYIDWFLDDGNISIKCVK